MSLDSIIERQHQLFGVISRSVENLGKLGPSRTTRGSVISRIEALKTNWEKFQANHEGLFRSCTADQRKISYFKDDLYSHCEEAFLNAHGCMLTVLESLDPPASQNPASGQTSMMTATNSRSRLLPRIDVPKFSGEYSQWIQFRDLFSSIIIENSDISSVEKLHYLKLSLSGDPAQHLKNIAISGENFTRAWESLAARYDNKRILINAQLASLFAILKVKSDQSIELKKLLGDLKEALGALEMLGCPVRHWDLIIIFMTVRKLDAESLKEWERQLGAQSIPPTFADLETFLLNRTCSLEALESSLPRKQQINSSSVRPLSNARTYTATAREQRYALCAADHYVSSCPKYLEKTTEQRREVVVSKGLCFNCLGPHPIKTCRNAKRCRLCRNHHHTTLHQSTSDAIPVTISSVTPPEHPVSVSSAHARVFSNENVALPRKIEQNSDHSSNTVQSHLVRCAPALLATAVVTVLVRGNQPVQLRALLDQGSEVSFISESAAQLLKLPRRAATTPIIGIGAQRNGVSNGSVSLTLQSRINPEISISIDALVLPKLTAMMPPAQLECRQWLHLQDLPLADPNFASPGKIDLLLGAYVYAQVLEDGLRRGGVGEPIAQRTSLGWILSGPLSTGQLNSPSKHVSVTGFHCSLDSELLETLQRFWSQEEIEPSSRSSLTEEESQCEDHFQKTYSRDLNGRFVVRLPLKGNVSDFGNSREAARQALFRMEGRFKSNPRLELAYKDFMREYSDLHHMRLTASPDLSQRREFFLPHHGVTRATSSTTKLRVVFNGSQKTSLGFSLNEKLHVGPKLQTEIFNVLIRWRRHQYVFAADIEKMYRQIRVHEEDWPLQKIFWRSSPDEEIREYHLSTVTYGLACAPYLALRCLQQLAQDSTVTHPLASDVLRQDIYVDDVLSGASDIARAQEQIRQLNEVLKAGGFNLRKWISNDSKILADIPPPHQESSSNLRVEDPSTHQTLGILWNRRSDSFLFSAPTHLTSDIISKRSVLSFIARMFDPLGWLAPIIIVAKNFMQELWAIRLDWDDELPNELKSRWIKFRSQLADVTTISIPRWLGTNTSTTSLELHGFADASQKALGAVIYLRVASKYKVVHTVLVSAKTKVAPLKRTTIPRLELSAAVLLTRQMTKIRETLALHQTPIHLWTDSTVALTWIKSHPSRWKDFVSHRVAFIQELSNSRWHHVTTKENPADLASRGTTPQQLQRDRLWWTGPRWLRDSITSWPSSIPDLNSNTNLEETQVTCITTMEKDPDLWDVIDRHSSLTQLLRLTAWLFRARNYFRKANATSSHTKVLTADELDYALLFWVKLTQKAYFPKEVRALQHKKPIDPSSKLLRLSPILDERGLLRLRGRLQFSLLDPAEKHPLILPRQSQLTTLVVEYHHRITLHGGPQLTLSSIRQRFWIIGGRLPIRSFIHRCITCCRHRAATSQQIIGQLPASRVTPCRPFYHTGVDYAGPLKLKTFRGRGAKQYKGYFIIFVCFSTSAVHLEVSTDYSTDGFLAAFKRFTGRRGLCSTITSDCGTNFIGADAELKRMFTASAREWSHLANLLANEGVAWKFNPPSAPHFGGKWEAGVKSVKHHLRRVVGETILTYEELSTLLTQIEAVLNSRPLGTLTDDPTDVSALTPGHFLVGSALTTVPEPSLSKIPASRLSRLQLLRQMLESFWHRWASEYLHELQTSSKWHKIQEGFLPGALVLIKDERLPPSKWPLGRIVDVYPGPDKLVRVVSVKTATSTLKRPIVKLCLLPKVT